MTPSPLFFILSTIGVGAFVLFCFMVSRVKPDIYIAAQKARGEGSQPHDE